LEGQLADAPLTWLVRFCGIFISKGTKESLFFKVEQIMPQLADDPKISALKVSTQGQVTLSK
jgi:hypothetical protein